LPQPAALWSPGDDGACNVRTLSYHHGQFNCC
jgi:hypothetical protein